MSHKVSIHTLYLLLCRSTLAAVANLGVSTSPVHLDLGNISHLSRQILSNSVRLDGKHLWTAIFRSSYRCSTGFNNGLWHSHSMTYKEVRRTPVLGLCPAERWNISLIWGHEHTPGAGFLQGPLCIWFLLSILTSFLNHASQKHPHTMPLPCFTIRIVLASWLVPGFCQK